MPVLDWLARSLTKFSVFEVKDGGHIAPSTLPPKSAVSSLTVPLLDLLVRELETRPYRQFLQAIPFFQRAVYLTNGCIDG